MLGETLGNVHQASESGRFISIAARFASNIWLRVSAVSYEIVLKVDMECQQEAHQCELACMIDKKNDDASVSEDCMTCNFQFAKFIVS